MSLKGLAKATLEILDRGTYTSDSGKIIDIGAQQRAAVDGTRLYTPEQAAEAALAPSEGPSPQIEITDETSQIAAQRLTNEGVTDIVLLNFASARNPGGGFLGGAKAQEEDLARSSGLYPCLITQPTYYEVNRKTKSLLYTDHLIYSPRVPFFRVKHKDLLDEPFLASVITSPAPNAGAVLNRDSTAGPAIEDTYRRRAGQVLAVARAHEHRTLILGAWGCGVFRNDPKMAAEIFKSWLNGHYKGAFERVVFAVYDRKTMPRYNAFLATFKSPQPE